MGDSPQRIKDLGSGELLGRLRNQGLILQMGPARVRVHTRIPEVTQLIALLYADYPVNGNPVLPDAELRLVLPTNLRRWWHPKVQCLVDGRPPFEALPLRLAYPMMEWALNWVVARRMQGYFMIHAAVVARGDRAVILPAWSGSGKSTLCAALVQHGWRFLSDEFCLLGLEDGLIHPIPRPIPLKNESIPAFRRFAPNAVMGPTFLNTRKGDITHVRPPTSSLDRIGDPVAPAWVVLPRYQADANTRLEPITPDRALLLMASNSFNFNLLGTPAFDALSRLIEAVECHRIAYSDLEQAVEVMDTLTQ